MVALNSSDITERFLAQEYASCMPRRSIQKLSCAECELNSLQFQTVGSAGGANGGIKLLRHHRTTSCSGKRLLHATSFDSKQ